MKYTSWYLYIGAYITDDASYRSSINLHVNDKKKHCLKYVSFVEKNPDLPFTIRKKVAEACIFSTILYGCETWCCSDFNKLESLYMRVVKALLAVLETTCNDQEKQQKYMCKKFEVLGEDSP